MKFKVDRPGRKPIFNYALPALGKCCRPCWILSAGWQFCARVVTVFGYVDTFVLKPAHVCVQVSVLFDSKSDLCEYSTEIITIASKFCVIVVAWLAILCTRHKNNFGHVVTFVLKPVHVCAQVIVLFESKSDLCEYSTEIITINTIASKFCVIVVAWLAILCARHKNNFGHVVTFVLKPVHVCAQVIAFCAQVTAIRTIAVFAPRRLKSEKASLPRL